ncbi:MAG: 50S ribosomal protein L25 [Candidatus Pacebacteria bacterium]|jgi:large subunit ribosomal protein L25|nr:50S ribosomal protein L25 [Candidatus Paceibacterota bacterium]
MFTLEATARTNKDSLGFFRAKGKLPAVFYGLGKESISIFVNDAEFKKVWKKAGETSTVTLETPSGKVETLIHEVKCDPVSGLPQHVDFLAIDTKKTIQIAVPLVFVGDAPAVKAGGILVKVLHEIEIEALPKDLPHEITVDVSVLISADAHIAVKDIALPVGVKAVTEADEIVASITHAQEENENTSPVDLSAIEVEKKGKKEEESSAE